MKQYLDQKTGFHYKNTEQQTGINYKNTEQQNSLGIIHEGIRLIRNLFFGRTNNKPEAENEPKYDENAINPLSSKFNPEIYASYLRDKNPKPIDSTLTSILEHRAREDDIKILVGHAMTKHQKAMAMSPDEKDAEKNIGKYMFFRDKGVEFLPTSDDNYPYSFIYCDSKTYVFRLATLRHYAPNKENPSEKVLDRIQITDVLEIKEIDHKEWLNMLYERGYMNSHILYKVEQHNSSQRL